MVKMASKSDSIADVSVVIPAYQAALTLGRALESVAQQTILPREIIIVDDGSDDNTFETASSYTDNLNGIPLKIFQQPNAGAGRARNKAIQEASGEYVAFLDADDEWLPKKLEKTMVYFSDSKYTLVAHDGWIVDGDVQTLNNCHQRYAEGADPYVTLFKKGFIDTCTVVARREAILAVGGFDESLPNAQDFELWLALCGTPEPNFIVFDKALSRYHLMPDSIMSYTNRRLSCCLAIAKRYSPEISQRAGANIMDLWYRIAAIHYEAFTAFTKNKAYFSASLLPIKMIFRFVTLSISYYLNKNTKSSRQTMNDHVPLNSK
jgi:teichuronic acid biosynthesis glycosyltransferase TuaG